MHRSLITAYIPHYSEWSRSHWRTAGFGGFWHGLIGPWIVDGLSQHQYPTLIIIITEITYRSTQLFRLMFLPKSFLALPF
jgi:hypothetical protein